MVIVQNHRTRKVTGGRYKDVISKRLAQKADLPALTKIDKTRVKTKKGIGGNLKQSTLSTNKVNLVDPKTKKSVVADITNVIESPSARQFIRRNIITKGATIETSKGKARVTSRPGQEGAINAVLIQ